jgi:hypothetical protein
VRNPIDDILQSPDLSGLTPEQLAFLAQFQDDTTPLTAFDLSHQRGRKAFLWRLSVLGEPALFGATAHVWNMLAAPKKAWCGVIANAALLHGTGKTVLLHLLTRFISEFDALATSELPEDARFRDARDWHRAVMETFRADEANAQAVIDKFERLLSPTTRHGPKESMNGVVIQGPWRGRSF